MANPTNSFRETNIVLQLIQESQIKSKTNEFELVKEKRGHILYEFILSERNLFNICAIPQCIVYRIQFQNIYTFTYQKDITSNILFVCLLLKLSKAVSLYLRVTPRE